MIVGKAGLFVDPDEKQRLHNFIYKYFIKYKTKAVTLIGQPTAKQFPAFYFFFEHDLHKGKTMPLSFPNSTNPATFLPRLVVDSIPFSSDNILGILNLFGVNPNSVEAKLANETIKSCNEGAEIKEEKKICVTSLESMVDLIKTHIGVDAKFSMSEMHGMNRVQKYRISGDVKSIATSEDNKDVMSCHKTNFVFGVFYCHSVEKTKVYMVPLVGDDGTKVDAIAICHGGTAGMSPEFWAFRVLGTKPGSTFCHFLPRDHMVFYN